MRTYKWQDKGLFSITVFVCLIQKPHVFFPENIDPVTGHVSKLLWSYSLCSLHCFWYSFHYSLACSVCCYQPVLPSQWPVTSIVLLQTSGHSAESVWSSGIGRVPQTSRGWGWGIGFAPNLSVGSCEFRQVCYCLQTFNSLSTVRASYLNLSAPLTSSSPKFHTHCLEHKSYSFLTTCPLWVLFWLH